MSRESREESPDVLPAIDLARYYFAVRSSVRMATRISDGRFGHAETISAISKPSAPAFCDAIGGAADFSLVDSCFKLMS